ncbi:hypothetical protein DIURU_000016 [Diutina rugosa]|uniref:Mitochondrial import inner membrane translocase subunit TIM22 n=1 Tax=Diutina rugosa TaxID=5481 RepID=A0A642UZ97_DIURU|nr:uncharacterized protein DIURU_000016 [Diutina rugosa]KAA8908703.1 hypothetical protein DIURU_000016 [Diutina rugosa]
MDPLRNQRFHMKPEQRLEAFSLTAGIIGGMTGFYEGVKMSSLRFLTENGHRLPQNVGGWYFYHKKKNYVMILSGVKQAFKVGTKYTLAVGTFFGLEATLDRARGSVDCLNTSAAAAICSASYAIFNRMRGSQIRKFTIRGGVMGLCLGFAQDFLIYARGGDVWYLESMGVKHPQVAQASPSADAPVSIRAPPA